MPGGSGAEFLHRVSQRYPNAIRILLTGEAGLDGAVRAINEGKVYRFLNKPISTDELANTIRRALRMREMAEISSELRLSR
jgi:DNA-binding NtrC family response regulator